MTCKGNPQRRRIAASDRNRENPCSHLQIEFRSKSLLEIAERGSGFRSSPNLVLRLWVLEDGIRAALFDGIEEGGIRATSSYPSHEIDEYDNNRALDGLQERVNILKGLTGDIHEEVESHNRMLDHMGNDMDSSRGILSGTMGKFKQVFETKSSRTMFTLVASFVVGFLIIYYLTR